MRLQDRCAIVTGAGKGMGRDIALTLAREGADVVLAGRELAPLEDLAAEIEAGGQRALAVSTDVSIESAVVAMTEQATAFFGGAIDILVAAAGITGPLETPVWELRVEDFDDIMAVNLRGIFLPVKHAVRTMIAGKGGRIVTIGGVAGLRGYKMRTANSASKWGMRGLVRTVALEAGSYNVNINNICPGITRTPRMEKLLAGKAAARGWSEEQVHEEYVQELSLGRVTEPQEIADAALFLVSDDARNITGQDLVVDGGWKL